MVKPPFHRSLWFLSAALLTVTLVGITAGTLASSRRVAVEPHSPLGVAETLDSLVQPRFFKLEDNRFGMSRIAVPQAQMDNRRHPIERFTPESEDEKERFASLFTSKRDYMVLFYRCAAPPPDSRPYLSTKDAEFRFVVGTPNQYNAFQKMKPDWHPLVKGQLSRLQRGIPVNRETDDWLLAIRPVKNHAQCVSCHTRSSPQDMLGIMVYAVRKTQIEVQKANPSIIAQRQSP